MNIDPRFSTVLDWADSMVDELIGYSLPPRLDDPEQWQAWALTVIQSPRIAVHNPPDPRAFSDWSEWAMRFNQAVPLRS